LEPGAENELILGRATYQVSSCTNSMGAAMPQLTVSVYLEGTLVGSFTLLMQTPGGAATFQSAVAVPAPGTDTARTMTAKVSDNCDEDVTVTDLKLDVAAFS